MNATSSGDRSTVTPNTGTSETTPAWKNTTTQRQRGDARDAARRTRPVRSWGLSSADSGGGELPGGPGFGCSDAHRRECSTSRLLSRAGCEPAPAVSTCTTSRLRRFASGCTLTDSYALSSSMEVTCPIGMPRGYSESSGLATVPEVYTYSPLGATVPPGRYCRAADRWGRRPWAGGCRSPWRSRRAR